MTSDHVTSADGTRLAFEIMGKGPALILIGGALCDRTAQVSGTPLAAQLAHRFTVLSYDRRGRGDSTDTPPYAIAREVEDLAALIAAAGGSAFVFGHASGGLLALDAAAHGLAIPRLACYEPPVLLDEVQARSFADLATQLDAAAAAGRRAEAVALYFTRVMEMPASVVAQMRRSPMRARFEPLAHTLGYDLRITARGPARLAQLSAVRAATILMDSGASPPSLRDAIQTLTKAIPRARHYRLEAQGHAVDPATLARALENVLRA
jgi:pimeloyl-ACP methyl ester carboxylesterase